MKFLENYWIKKRFNITRNEVEIRRHNRLVQPERATMPRRRNPRPVAAEVEEQDVARTGPIHHPAESRPDICARGHDGRARRIHQELHIVRFEPEPLQERLPHGKHIVDATMQLVLGVRVVAPNQNGQPPVPDLHR